MPGPHPRPPSVRTPPARTARRPGSAATTFGVLRRHRATLAGATVRVVGAAGATGLLVTAAVFALAWPVFTRMRNRRAWYQYVEDPYLHESTDLVLVALCTLPLFLLLFGIGSATLQSVCSRMVTEETDGERPEAAESGDEQAGAAETGGLSVVAGAGSVPVRERERVRPVLLVYALRGLIVWPLPIAVAVAADSLTGYHLDTPLPLERGSWPYVLVSASPAVALGIAVLLRLALSLAPAAAADGLGPWAAVRRSWSLTWTRTGAPRVLALAVPLAALAAGVLRLAVQVALPLRPAVRGLLEPATGNFFAAYYAGILAPVVVGVLVTAALVLPVACTAFAVLHGRLRAPVRRG
ncbi:MULTISPECIES: hypothetical protein [Streptomyces]|uniref:hypothetical protein n=1 Tax=Streptomyces TaxID=1883 RepID=UPI00068C29DB|nr:MULTISPECIES: hypothetical protein [Streptomyces]MDP9948218.1 hypothetical protein [Streptomyces sp. DSM 41269]